jgi:predicted ATP-binding protein involved in virulence
MRINQLVINNFRGFEQATIDFPKSNLCVFIGTNGKGKTSVLDVTGMFLTEFLNRLSDKHLIDFDLQPDDINFKSNRSDNSISLRAGDDCRRACCFS